MRLLFLAVTLAAATTAHAQSIAGKWDATFPMRIRNENGNFTADTGKAELVIKEVKGDSVFGTWHPTNAPVASEPRAIKGTFINGRLIFSGAPREARMQMNGETQTISMVTYFDGNVDGDKITGSMYNRSLDGSIESPPMAWKALRVTQ